MAVKYTLYVEGENAAELGDAVADLAMVIGANTAGAPADDDDGASDDAAPDPGPAPKPKKGGGKKKAAPKAKAEEDEGPTIEDVKEVAAELVDAVGGDMERAQELVHSEFKVRRVSELDRADYARFVKWTRDQIETLQELYGNSEGQQEEQD